MAFDTNFENLSTGSQNSNDLKNKTIDSSSISEISPDDNKLNSDINVTDDEKYLKIVSNNFCSNSRFVYC